MLKKLTIPLCDITLCDNVDIPISVDGRKLISKLRNKVKYQDPNVDLRRIRNSEEEESEDDHSSDPDWKDEGDYSVNVDFKKEVKVKKEEYNIKLENLSEYEKMVQRNREEKLAFLELLKINEAKEDFMKTATSFSTKERKSTPKVTKRPRSLELIPVRKSRRLANLDINLSEEALYEKAIDDAVEDQKQKELPRHYPFKEAMQEEEDYSDFTNHFHFETKVEAKPYNNYVSRFNHMKLEATNIAKVVPTRITTLAVHPSTENIIIVAGSKYGHLGFWNVTSDLNPIVFTPHLESITNLKFDPNDALKIVSSSYDGTLRCGDIEKKVFNEMYNVSEETCCTYFDFLSSNTLLVSMKSGNVSVVDVRIRSQNNEKRHNCHDRPVKTVSVHPVNRNLFLSADSKGVMKLWDLRKLQKKPIIKIEHHRRSISSAFFSPVTGNFILSTSIDDSICIFDSSNVDNEILFKKSISHNNHTGRWLTPFRAKWLPNNDDAFSVGCMLEPRRIQIFNNRGTNIHTFMDDYLTSVTSVNEFHPSLSVLAGANSSGRVFIFVDKILDMYISDD